MTALPPPTAPSASPSVGHDVTGGILRGLRQPRDVLNLLDVYQATRLRDIIGEQRLSLSQFVEAFFKAVGSVSLYRHRAEAEAVLERLFREVDLDNDRRITFPDLPMNSALLGDPIALAGGTPGQADREVVVYNDLAGDLLLPVLDKTAGDTLQARRSAAQATLARTNAKDGAQNWTKVLGAAQQQQIMLEYLSELDLNKCTSITYHPTLKRHTIIHGSDVIIFALNEYATGFADPHLLAGRHTSPVLAVVHIPHLKRLITAGADRAIVAWSDSDRFHALESVRSISPQTCIAYDALSQCLVTGGVDGMISVFPALPELGHCRRAVQAHTGWVQGLVFLRDIDAFATCGADGTLKLWDRQTLAERNSKVPPGRSGNSLGLLQHSKALRCLFTTASHGRELLMWSPFLPSPTETLRGHDKPIAFVKAFHDSAELITADQSGKVSIWDMRKTIAVQHMGGPDSVSPIGRVTGCSYDTARNAIVVLGDRLHVFLPQRGGGAQTALIDSPISAVISCTITRRVFLASGGRLLVFELTTGQLLLEHSVGTLDVCSLALGVDRATLVVGTHEGTVLTLLIGSWQVTQRVICGGAVRHVADLGLGHRLGSAASDWARAVAICSNGDVWHFPHGPLCQSATNTTVVLRTGLADVAICAFSTVQGFVAMAQQDSPTALVWDLGVHMPKPSLTIRLDPEHEGTITTLEIVDAMEAVFTASSTGLVKGFAITTSTCVFTLKLTSGELVPRSLRFAREPWRLAVMAADGITSVDLEQLTRLVVQYQATVGVTFTTAKSTVQRRYEADLGTGWNRQWTPAMLRCMRRSGKAKHAEGGHGVPAIGQVRSLFVCEPRESHVSVVEADVLSFSGLVPASSGAFGSSTRAERRSPGLDDGPTRGTVGETTSERERNQHLVRRLQRLADAQRSADHDGHPWRHVARLQELYVPTSADVVMEHAGKIPAYIITARLSRSTAANDPFGGIDGASSWATHFDRLADHAETSGKADARPHALDELRWFVLAAARAVTELSSGGVVPLMNAGKEMGWDGYRFRLVPSAGVWKASDDDNDASLANFRSSTSPLSPPSPDGGTADQRVALPAYLVPPEGWEGTPTVKANMWWLGLFVYRVACKEHLFSPSGAKLGDVEHAFLRVFSRDLEGSVLSNNPASLVHEQSLDDVTAHVPFLTREQLLARLRPCYRQTWVLTLLGNLLCTPTTRWHPGLVADLLDAPAPRHLVRLKLGTRADLVAMDGGGNGLVIDMPALEGNAAVDGIVAPLVRPALPHAMMTAVAMSESPPLYLSAIFGQSAHVVATTVDGHVVGIVPAINELRIPWSVDSLEVAAASVDNAALTKDELLEATGGDDDGSGGGARDRSKPRGVTFAAGSAAAEAPARHQQPDVQQAPTLADSGGMAVSAMYSPTKARRSQLEEVIDAVEDEMTRCTPFFSSVQEGRREADVDVLQAPAGGGSAELPYYLQGWHKVDMAKLALIKRGTSREMSALEERVFRRRKVLGDAHAQRVAQDDERRRVAAAAATTSASPVRSQNGDVGPGSSDDDNDRGSAASSHDRLASILNEPIRGIDLPPDPAFIMRRRKPAETSPSPSSTSTRRRRDSATPSLSAGSPSQSHRRKASSSLASPLPSVPSASSPSSSLRQSSDRRRKPPTAAGAGPSPAPKQRPDSVASPEPRAAPDRRQPTTGTGRASSSMGVRRRQ